MIRQSSIKAITKLRDEGIIGLRQYLVLESIRNHSPCTDSEIMANLGFKDRNAVSPRRNELMKLEIVKKHNVRNCKITGYKATTWTIDNKVVWFMIIGERMISKTVQCKHCNGKGRIKIKTWKKI